LASEYTTEQLFFDWPAPEVFEQWKDQLLLQEPSGTQHGPLACSVPYLDGTEALRETRCSRSGNKQSGRQGWCLTLVPLHGHVDEARRVL